MASFLLTSSYHISCAKLDTLLTDVRNSQTFGPSNISKPYEFKPAKLSYFMFNQSNSRLFSQRVSKKESGITSDETSEPEKPSRRGRKKGTLSVPASRKDKKNEEEKSELEDEGEGEQNIEANRKHIASSKKTKRSEDKESDSEENLESDKIKPRRRRKASVLSSSGRNKKSVKNDEEFEDDEEEDYDDEMEFPYESPPLVCCFGAVRREFIPTVRISDRQMDPDKYSTWKNLQWSPPEFARAPGGPPSNVAISHCRLGGRAAFIGKVGDDDFGKDLVYRMNLEKVQTRGTKIDSNVKTSISYMKLRFENGKIKANVEKECAENSLTKSELNLSILREAKIFHFNSEVLASPSMHSALFKAIRMSKKFGGLIFFDLNLSLPLWRSRDETREIISKAWNQSNIIEVTKQELEFLLDEDYYEKMRNYTPQYFSETYDQTKKRRGYYHYTKEEISPLWHDDIKIMFVTDGTLRIHYYTPDFDGVVIGTEDVLITPFTCDRTGSGDAVTAGIMRKLTTHPEMYNDQDILERHLRFAIAAGIISQWTIGAVRGFPSESATQNLKEQVYVPSMW